jgi:hypothetical protein
MKTWTTIAIILMTTLLVGGGCTMSTYKAETGNGDASTEWVLVKPEKNIAISRIDGKTVFVTARNWWVPVVTKTRASLKPGEHNLVITYARTGWTSQGCQVTLDAQPGKTYVVKAKAKPFDNATGFAAVNQPQIASVVVWVVDADTGETVVGETACQPLTS